jgi:protein-tyrosine phosphatase
MSKPRTSRPRRLALTGVALASSLAAVCLTAPAASARPALHRLTHLLAARDAAGDYSLSWTDPAGNLPVDLYASTDPSGNASPWGHVQVSRTGTATLTGLDPLNRWYFELCEPGGRSCVEVADRAVNLEGVANARDMGGLPAAGGRTIKWGVVFRSAKPTTADATGVEELARLGLTEVVDFRTAAETALGGPDPLPATVVHISDPVGEPSQAVPPPVNDPPSSGNPIEDSYRLFASNPYLRAEFADGLRRAADAGQRPILFHCTGGNHRTGWMAVVLLKALGVPDDVVQQDYLQSTSTDVAYLNAAYDEVQLQYGSFGAYLRDGLGIDDATVEHLRAELLTRG